MSPVAHLLLPRDFIATRTGLLCAVIAPGCEQNRVLATVRYARIAGRWRKLETREANAFIADTSPAYRYYSNRCSAYVHGIPVEDITQIFKPRERLAQLMQQPSTSGLEAKAHRLATTLAEHGVPPETMGLTGSLLVNRHGLDSDIDMVLYDRQAFHLARAIVKQLVAQERVCHPITLDAWHWIYDRRGCALTFDEFLWHEQRKYNKAMVSGTKFDLTLYVDEPYSTLSHTTKMTDMTVEARVTDASRAYDYPAVYRVESAVCQEICSFTQTYCGQALVHENVIAHGTLERDAIANGPARLVIGTSREAESQYIKVVK